MTGIPAYGWVGGTAWGRKQLDGGKGSSHNVPALSSSRGSGCWCGRAIQHREEVGQVSAALPSMGLGQGPEPQSVRATTCKASTCPVPQLPQLLSVIEAEMKYPVLIVLSSRGAWRMAATMQAFPICCSGRFCTCRQVLLLALRNRGVAWR